MIPILQMKKLRPRDVMDLNNIQQTECDRDCISSVYDHLDWGAWSPDLIPALFPLSRMTETLIPSSL